MSTTLPRSECLTIAYLAFLPSISPQDLDCSLDGVTMLSSTISLERAKLIRAQLSSTRDLSSSSSSSSSEPSSTGGAFARVVAEAIAASGPIFKPIEQSPSVTRSKTMRVLSRLCCAVGFRFWSILSASCRPKTSRPLALALEESTTLEIHSPPWWPLNSSRDEISKTPRSSLADYKT
jgi:hypothetical protein